MDVIPSSLSDTEVANRLAGPETLAKLLGKADPAQPSTLVIFGAGGDLTKRLLMPSLYNLREAGLLQDGFKIVGVDRLDLTDESFQQNLTTMMESFVTDHGGEFAPANLDDGAWGWLRQHISYHKAEFGDVAGFKALKEKIAGPCIFYLAIAAGFFGTVVEKLAEAGLLTEEGGAWRRLVVEKPFGHDLASARALNQLILSHVDETQVYRIDHFLGKETVQNIMALRFSNGIFEPLWNRFYIDHVQITAAETVGVESRGKFYEPTGALRDMMPNHMFQLLSMVAMEPPNSFDADAVRSEKAKVIQAIKPMDPMRVARDTVRGQYERGTIRGQPSRGYRAEPDVAADSTTETFVALRLKIDNFRWAGVPFYVRTGKHMSARNTEIAIAFKQAPYALFRETPVEHLTPNVMTIHVQPSEGITLQLSAKIPGPKMELGAVAMDFRYSDYFHLPSATGYETLLYDVMIGDQTLFQRADNVEAGWAAVDPILTEWAKNGDSLQRYTSGSTGPAAADRLLDRDGRHWLPIAP